MNAIQLAKSLTGAAACLTLLPLNASAQEDFDPAKMEEIKKKYWSPGKEHKVLRSWVGTWKTKNSFWVQPGAPPMTNEGESKFRMLLKGRYLSEQFSAESEEMGEFKGQGTVAYDRVSKEYTHTWIDSMSTGMMVSRGKNSADGSRIEYTSTVKDAITMQDVKYRIVSHYGDPKNRKMEMFATYPGKKEFKNMEITYTKVAGPAKKGAGKAKSDSKEK
jgi:hypothetical protein